MSALWIGLLAGVLAGEGVPPDRDLARRVRTRAEPCHPMLAAWLDAEGAVPRGSGGRRTQAATAWAVTPGLWATAGHATAGAAFTMLSMDEGPVPVRVVARSVVDDIAILAADTPHAATDAIDPEVEPPAPPRPSSPETSVTVRAVGYPGDGPREVLEGPAIGPWATRLPGHPPQALWRIGIPVRRGLSGAPVLHGGSRVGMIVAGSTDTSPLGGDGLMIPEPRLSSAVRRMRHLDPTRRAGIRATVSEDGVIVTAVRPDGDAASAGLLVGDRILLAGDLAVHDLRTLWEAIVSLTGPWMVRSADGEEREVGWPPI